MVGTYGHEIYEIAVNMKTGAEKNKPAICHISGHSEPMRSSNNEIWGLTPFNFVEKSITTSDDCTLRVWDNEKHKQIAIVHTDVDIKGNKLPGKDKKLAAGGMGRCVTISPTDNMIAVGMADGTVRLYQFANNKLKLMTIKNLSKRPMSDIKFSPNGEFIACACSDAIVYILVAD